MIKINDFLKIFSEAVDIFGIQSLIELSFHKYGNMEKTY